MPWEKLPDGVAGILECKSLCQENWYGDVAADQEVRFQGYSREAEVGCFVRLRGQKLRPTKGVHTTTKNVASTTVSLLVLMRDLDLK